MRRGSSVVGRSRAGASWQWASWSVGFGACGAKNIAFRDVVGGWRYRCEARLGEP